MRKRVYIACPITKGDRVENFAQACDAQRELIWEGFAPMNPALSMLHPAAWQIAHGLWLEVDLPWVMMAEAVLRLPGESLGADREVAMAKHSNIPVFSSVESLVKHFAGGVGP